VNLDAVIQTYVPSFPSKSAAFTVRQLAGHLAGIRHYQGSEFTSRRRFESVAEALETFKDDSLLFTPGAKFGYSTYGYTLLSAVIESASGEDFLRYVQTAVLDPLALSGTIPDYPDSVIVGRASFYDRLSYGWRTAPYVDNSNKWAGGGSLSTAEDLVRFGSALLQPGFLSQGSLTAMFESQRLSNGEPSGYGVGWFVQTDSLGHPLVYHGGSSIGGTARLTLHRRERLVVAVLVNTTASRFVARAVDEIAHLFLRTRVSSACSSGSSRHGPARAALHADVGF
jgi:CubicO group peptidase (beta-lactamase class C family)